MDIPDFIKIDHDVEARRATLSVANRDEKQQREMWGTENTLFPQDVTSKFTGAAQLTI